jgi:hypothetical protein
MGDRRTREPLNSRNFPLRCKEHATAFFPTNMRKITDKVAINHFFLSTNLK